MQKTVSPASLCGTLDVIPSKSASHRAVMMAALCKEETRLAPLQRSRDIEATLACAAALGLGQHDAPQELRTLDCGESGSTLRFFIPLALDGCGPVRFVGHGRLMQRPLSVYEQLFVPRGVRWALSGDTLTVEGQLQGGEYALRGDVSSQFITGLLLALPLLSGDSVIRITTALESRGYVELTRRIQAAFGVASRWADGHTLLVPGGQTPVSPGSFAIEGDWSHAAFYLVAGALGKAGPLTLRRLCIDSTQGDRAIVPILRGMGARIEETSQGLTVYPSVLHGAQVDVTQVPDLVPVLTVAMAGAQGESRITGAARLRIKESDRLSAIASALCACGAEVRELPDGLVIRGGQPLHGAAVDGRNDHRIVMAMAVAAALCDGEITISDAEAVAKSAPAFWQEYASLGGQAR